MKKRWLVIGTGAVLVIASIALIIFGFAMPSSAQNARIVQSDAYWQVSAKPFAVMKHRVNGNDGEMEIVMQSIQENDELTLTGINATFGAAALNTNNGSVAVARGLPLKFGPGEKKTVEMAHNAKAPPGEIYEIDFEFTYEYQNGTEMRHYSARPLIGRFT